jgi:hypothetical protein
MLATVTDPKQLERHPANDLESVLWKALDMDDFSDEMVFGSLTSGQPRMGTGYTVNACNACSSNSNTTHGCGTCCR